jgi:hypothetical protein
MPRKKVVRLSEKVAARTILEYIVFCLGYLDKFLPSSGHDDREALREILERAKLSAENIVARTKS